MFNELMALMVKAYGEDEALFMVLDALSYYGAEDDEICGANYGPERRRLQAKALRRLVRQFKLDDKF